MKRKFGIAALLREGFSMRDPYDSEADTCFAIEHELHQKVDGDYPVAKYQIEGEMLEELAKKMKKHSTSSPNVMGGQFG